MAMAAEDLNKQTISMLDNITQTSKVAMGSLDMIHDLFAKNNKEDIEEAHVQNDDVKRFVGDITNSIDEVSKMLPETPEISNILREIQAHLVKSIEKIRQTGVALEAMDLNKAAKLNGEASDQLNAIRELVNGIKAQL